MSERELYFRINPETLEKAYTDKRGSLVSRQPAAYDEILLWQELQRLRKTLGLDPDERVKWEN